MTDHFARPHTAASSERVAQLHKLCDADYAKGQAERATARVPALSYTAITAAAATAEPSDLDVAISVAQQLLDSSSVLSLREALRLLLRALGAEPSEQESASIPRCPAAYPEDPTPCSGPVVVTVLDAQNAGADGCERHAARLLASLTGGRPVAKPDAPVGAALRVFTAAGKAGEYR